MPSPVGGVLLMTMTITVRSFVTAESVNYRLHLAHPHISAHSVVSTRSAVYSRVAEADVFALFGALGHHPSGDPLLLRLPSARLSLVLFEEGAWLAPVHEGAFCERPT